MKQRMYVKAATAISPQHTFLTTAFPAILESSSNGMLHAVEPDYRPYINAVAVRRMSRLIKMAITAAMQCLKDAEVASPDAIITGTGRGSMTDMELFVKDMIRLEEEALNPTIFIQSTYNAPNGWIAQLSKSTAYNQTYVHRGCSLELALLDAQLLIAEANDGPQNILVGSYDELTDEYLIIKDKLGYWKSPAPPSLELQHYNQSKGTIGGEGATFFTLSNDEGSAKVTIEDIQLIQEASAANILAETMGLLERNNLSQEDIDVLLCGLNGDIRHQSLYQPVLDLLKHNPVATFKQLCGEYDTATGFGLWLAIWLLSGNNYPAGIMLASEEVTNPDRILFINHYITGSAVIMLLGSTK